MAPVAPCTAARRPVAWIVLDSTGRRIAGGPGFKGNPEQTYYVTTDMFYQPDEWILFAARAALLAVTLLCFALAFASWRRSGRRDMQGVMAETRALSELTQRLGAQLAALEARIEDRRELAAAAAGPAQRGYDLALQMARNGVAAEQIVSTSGVARNEAQLLARLHGPARN